MFQFRAQRFPHYFSWDIYFDKEGYHRKCLGKRQVELMFLIILFRFFFCRCYRCYILNSRFFSIIRPSPPPSPKTLKTTMKREQKLVASMNTCLLWRHKVSRKHFRVFCSPELYYFKEDRAKAVNKSYPQIFFHDR